MSDTHQTLVRLAEALGVPIETFVGPFHQPDREMLAELISLWLAIGRGTDRNKVLGYARAILAAQRQGPDRR